MERDALDPHDQDSLSIAVHPQCVDEIHHVI